MAAISRLIRQSWALVFPDFVVSSVAATRHGPLVLGSRRASRLHCGELAVQRHHLPTPRNVRCCRLCCFLVASTLPNDHNWAGGGVNHVLCHTAKHQPCESTIACVTHGN
jgi:hypothetical protein